MATAPMMANVYLWIGATFLFFILFCFAIFFIWFLSKRTHALIEFKAMIKGKPIAMFFQENGRVLWKPVEPEAGIIVDKDFGAFVINDKATYVDQSTKNIFIPFDASFGASVNVHAAKLAEDLGYMMKDEEKMKALRHAISNNMVDESETITALKTSINFGAIKNMMNALIPHAINEKISKVIASKIKGFGGINITQIILVFVSIFGAICLGALVIWLTMGSKKT